MRHIILTLGAFMGVVAAEVPSVPKSLSPDGKIHAVMDVDRDPTISPEWKGDSFPRIEITQKETGRVLTSIEYFGSAGATSSLRNRVHLSWRPDSKAFGLTIRDRFYSYCTVFVLNKDGKFVSAPIPTDYEKLTGFPTPDVKHLRPRGSNWVVGWDAEGRLIYGIFRSPMATFKGKDPLRHRVYLEVTPAKVTVVKVEHEKGEWRRGDWIPAKVEQGGAKHPAPVPKSKPQGKEKPNPESEGRSK